MVNYNPISSNRISTTALLCGAGFEVFLTSVLILFLELACIRWFSAHVLFLTFFTNTVLLACFLGMSVGCLTASHAGTYLNWTPALLLVALSAPYGVSYLQDQLNVVIDTKNAQASPELIFFGTEYPKLELARFVIPVELFAGFFFLILSLVFMGLGQQLARSFKRLANRVLAYTLNTLGSIAGIVLFTICSWLCLPPLWWFMAIALGLGALLFRGCLIGGLIARMSLNAVLLFAVIYVSDSSSSISTRTERSRGRYVALSPQNLLSPFHPESYKARQVKETLWSPYYRIDYDPSPNPAIYVNLIIHQHMISKEQVSPAYALPHLLNRDAGGQAFCDVLIIGAGTGNDVSRALQWGARHVDAVEIDPAILRLGQRDHPDRPYEDHRVSLHVDDGRNFLRTTANRQYDLIVYALVDSLVLHSSYSSIRLESYLFTRQAFADVRGRLKPGGLFVMYNNFRQGWLVARLQQELAEVFKAQPLVLALPYRERLLSAERYNGFTMLVGGSTERISRAFHQHPSYWLRTDEAVAPDSRNGFMQRPRADERIHWRRLGLARVIPPEDALHMATDDWPFLYLRQPMIPELSLRSILVIGSLSLLMLCPFVRPRKGQFGCQSFYWRMFFLGAGFMLVETKAVVHMALLSGSTWIVNAIVFLAVLLMVLAANLFVLGFRPKRLWPHYVGLLVTLGLNSLIRLDLFLGSFRTLQLAASCLLVFAPILFAALIFAVLFSSAPEPDRALGANSAGCIVGGLAENAVMLLGFQYLVVVTMAFYALSAVLPSRPVNPRNDKLLGAVSHL